MTYADLTPEQIAGEVEKARLGRALFLQRLIAKYKLELGCLTSQIRTQMNRDGCVRHKIPGVGTATLLPGREIKLCDCCEATRTLDPYLKIEPEKNDDAGC